MFNKHFRKYIFKYSLYLLIGIFILIVIDYVQLEIPKSIGQIVNTLDNATILEEFKILDKQKDYELVFTFDQEEEVIFWYKEKTDGEISRSKLLINSNDLEALKTLDENSLIVLENNILKANLNGVMTNLITIEELQNILTNNYKVILNVIMKSLIIIVLVVTLGRFLWRLAIFGTSRKIEYGLRNEMFQHATSLSQEYYSHQKVGGMMTYFINDLNAVRMALGPGIMMLIDSFFLGGFTLYRMFNLNIRLTLIVLIPMTLLIIAMAIISNSMRKQFKIRQEKFRDLSDYTQENFSGLAVIKAYVREAYEIITFQKLSKELYDTNLKFFKKQLNIQILTGIIVNIVIFTIIGFGAYIVIESRSVGLNVGELTEYISLFFALSWPMMALVRFFSMFSQAQASAARITEFLNTKPTVIDHNTIEVSDVVPKIEAKNLNFTYPDGNELVLEDINFTIEAGEMVGILGKTGSGKTTLVDILLRVYNIEENTLLLGGHDIMRLPIKDVRNLIGYVPQDNFLFSDTIKANIAFSKEFISDDEIIESAKLADIYENVSEFKEGFETILGERGVTVSGGQKQRISIARALAKNPNILILDDSVSAVDTKTEETIINNLYNLRQGKTTIFIAHRISTVKDLDKIIIIDEGKIVGIGTHQQLLKTSPFYQDIVRRQTLEEKVEGGQF